ncbi:MAG: peptide ABC transporter substrate-binding protein [Anaerolineae bacterium]|nr:peptide ABC transporter substrate-binding protein [Anaerolineae bacterium]MCB0200029.1 peptide ABC transporter substrate-binding protein [Anaerolineae bacterium]MCB0253648.1 peptide ABC transporter substrate-binding protein [Anaerolineae bacterium]
MKTIKGVVLLALAVMGLAGCAAAPAQSGNPAPAALATSQPAVGTSGATAVAAPDDSQPVTLNINVAAEPPTLDPSLATDAVSLNVMANLFVGLTRLSDADDGSVDPELATGWEVSDDGLIYTFHLRDDARWVRYTEGDGVEQLRPVAARDVVYGVRRTCDPRTGSEYAYVDYIIAGCAALNNADAVALSETDLQAMIDAVGVTAPDATTVEFTLTTPAPYFPAIAGMWINWPQYREVIENAGDGWTEPGVIVTNGPYVLTEWRHNDSMAAMKNPLWYGWPDARGNIERVEMSMLGEPATAYAMYEAGALDTTTVPPPDIPAALADSTMAAEVHRYATSCSNAIGFTATKPPMDNILVRKALSAAIDRQSLVDNVLKGGEIPANSFAPAMIFGNTAGDSQIAPWTLPADKGGWGYDMALKQAQEWLAEAGYPNGEGFPVITLMHAQIGDSAQVMQAIQAMWEQGLDIKVSVESQEFGVYLATTSNMTPVEERPHAFRLIWCADYPDENNWLHEVFNTDEGMNLVSWDRDANTPLGPDGMSFNEMTVAAQQTTDPATRQNLYAAAEKVLVDDAAAIAPLNYSVLVEVTKPYLERTYPGIGVSEWRDWVLDWQTKQLVISN